MKSVASLLLKDVPGHRVRDSSFWTLAYRQLVHARPGNGPKHLYERLLPYLNTRPLHSNVPAALSKDVSCSCVVLFSVVVDVVGLGLGLGLAVIVDESFCSASVSLKVLTAIVFDFLLVAYSDRRGVDRQRCFTTGVLLLGQASRCGCRLQFFLDHILFPSDCVRGSRCCSAAHCRRCSPSGRLREGETRPKRASFGKLRGTACSFWASRDHRQGLLSISRGIWVLPLLLLLPLLLSLVVFVCSLLLVLSLSLFPGRVLLHIPRLRANVCACEVETSR